MLALAIWSVLRSNVGASYLVSAAQQCWRELLGQYHATMLFGCCCAAMLARASWSMTCSNVGASYLVSAGRELCAAMLARATWSVLCFLCVVSAAQQCWREQVFGQCRAAMLARAFFGQRCAAMLARAICQCCATMLEGFECFLTSGKQEPGSARLACATLFCSSSPVNPKPYKRKPQTNNSNPNPGTPKV